MDTYHLRKLFRLRDNVELLLENVDVIEGSGIYKALLEELQEKIQEEIDVVVQ